MNNSPNFNKDNGLVPVIVQHAISLQVLMLAYMNEEAYHLTLKNQKLTFYSRSRQSIWQKGETSGNTLHLVSLTLDCDNDTILAKALPTGPVCHTGADTCFGNYSSQGFLPILQDIVEQRINAANAESYSYRLFQKGINKMAQKVGEEAVELVIEAKDSNDDLFLNEAADLLFHFIVLLQAKGKKWNEVEEILRRRHQEQNR